MNFENVKLPTYTKGEEIFNSVTHGVGILFGLFSLIMFLLKSASRYSLIGAIIFGVSMIILYTSSTVYHALKPSYIKQIMRVVDHAVIYLLIEGTSIPIMLIGVMPYNKVFAYIMITLSITIGTVGTILTYIDQEKFKVIQTVLYMVLGWMCLVLIIPLYRYLNNAVSLIVCILLGGTIYTVGTAFLALGKKKKYFHSIFHIFVLCGSLIHFLGLYFYLY